MKRALKGYFAFTNKTYRLVTLILLPLLAVVLTVVVGAINIEVSPIVMVGYYAIFMVVEPMTDYWFMGGFYGKNKGALEFMQSSNRFSAVIKDVVVVDMVRRLLVNAFLFLLMVVAGVIAGIKSRGFVFYAFLPILEILFAEIVVLIGRHFDLWNHYYVVIVLGYMVSIFIMFQTVVTFETYMGVICVVMAVLALMMAAITVAYTNKKVRDSYYDK